MSLENKDAKPLAVKEAFAGVLVLFIVIALSFWAGVGHGHEKAYGELPQLAATNAKLDKIQKTLDAVPECNSVFLGAVRADPAMQQ